MASNFSEVGKHLVGSLVPVAANLAPGYGGGALRKILIVAIDGNGTLPGAKSAAAHQLQKHGNVNEAIDALASQHVALAGAQGFVTNIGGLLTTVITLPANALGLAVLQARLVASIAHLRGYDVDDPRVRTAIGMCLVGDDLDEILGDDLPNRPLVVATAPVYDPTLDQQISDKIATELITRLTGKRMVVAMTKRVPVLGGGIGAAFDGWDTYQISRFALTELVDRRQIRG